MPRPSQPDAPRMKVDSAAKSKTWHEREHWVSFTRPGLEVVSRPETGRQSLRDHRSHSIGPRLKFDLISPLDSRLEMILVDAALRLRICRSRSRLDEVYLLPHVRQDARSNSEDCTL